MLPRGSPAGHSRRDRQHILETKLCQTLIFLHRYGGGVTSLRT